MAIEIPGSPPAPAGSQANTVAYEVTPDYFDVMGVPLTRGRSFRPEDRPAGEDASGFAVVVNESFVRAYSPDVDPIGHQIVSRLPGAESSGPKAFTIVGVARNFRMERPPRPIAPAMFIYAPLGHNNTALIVRTRLAAPEEIVPAVRSIVHELDPGVRVAVVQPFQPHLERALWRERTYERVLALFGGLALGLTVVGLYGIIAFTVARRTREFGVRLALGAARHQIFTTVVRQGLTLTSLGVTVGIAVSLGFTRLLAGLLYEIRPTDPITFAAAAIVLGLLAVLAGAIPAFRATAVDPARTLRME